MPSRKLVRTLTEFVSGNLAGFNPTGRRISDSGIAANKVVTSDTVTGLKIWTGDKTAYDAITKKDAGTLYFVS